MTGTSRSGTGSQTALRGRNTAAIVRALTVTGPQLQADLSRVTGLSRATVSNIVALEVEAGRLRAERVLRDGRWGLLVSRAPEDWVVAGIDIGRSHLRVVARDAAARTVGDREIALDPGHLPDVTLARASELLDEVVAQAGLSRSRVRKVGIALPASVGPDGAVVQQSVLREWSGMNVAERAAGVLGIETVVDNDANLGAFAHAAGRGGRGTLVYLKVASGIGAGIVVGDRLYRSTTGLVGEIGHVQVVDGGQTCYCGSRGCLETLASVRTVVADFERVHGRAATLDDVLAAIAADDPVALRIVTEAGDALGRVLAVMCNILSPDVVVVGGPLTPVGAPLLDAIVASVRKRALPAAISRTEFAVSDSEPRAEVSGACLLALQALDAEDLSVPTS
ncbi:ROK family protein [Xylanimonas cellulosilytica DSM 15894]|uniref:ROK family protein n=1 Tax=Xylanimonas cellulosilytica (strain DSM 15894 / JCM 12276 / CECT 5975 / KCTC 9989 / LMG 20990 / NBRC 107835 / XIL07) TaxID=446471 RepID=D1BUQ4_XYLCX|nr:ROK family transcriptional regulator [Xylanimonas cellulosilytica]ACZ29295.1 ROK family protein [Xylanimonas cellulosilytica DSM 15894]